MMSGITKIKICIALGVSVALFGVWGWSWVQPTDGFDSLTMVLGKGFFKILLTALLLGFMGTTVGILIDKTYGFHLGALAIPVGLTVWSAQTSNMERLLVSHSTAADRAGMFFALTGEAFIWFSLIGLGWAASWWLRGRGGLSGVEAENNLTLAPVQKGSSGRPKGAWLSNVLPKNVWLHGVCGLVLCSVVAIILIVILGQARQVSLGGQRAIEASMVPPVGQIVFAVGVGFFVAGLAGHQLTGAPLWQLAGAPILAAVIAYLYGAFNGILETTNGAGPAFVPSSAVFATILPVQYLGVGTLAVMLGYYYSVDISGRQTVRH